MSHPRHDPRQRRREEEVQEGSEKARKEESCAKKEKVTESLWNFARW
jgi:hypothetical protein